MQRILIGVSVLTAALCIYLLNENENLQTQLKEEATIRYEYSAIIDSLETELENTRHWYEWSETQSEQIHSEWEYKHNSAVQ